MDPVEIVRECYAAWNAGDIRPILHRLHPDVDWRPSAVFPGIENAYRGHAGVLRWREAPAAPFARFHVTVLRAEAEGDVVTAHVHFDAVGATSGARVELDFVNEWRFHDGLVIGFRAIPAA